MAGLGAPLSLRRDDGGHTESVAGCTEVVAKLGAQPCVMDTVEEIMRTEGVSAEEARKILRERKNGQGVEEAQQRRNEELQEIAAARGMDLEQAKLITDEERKRESEEVLADAFGMDLESYRLEMERREKRRPYWRRVQKKVVREYAAARGVDEDEVYRLFDEERRQFRKAGEKPSYAYLRFHGADYQTSAEEHWEYMQLRRRSLVEKSKRQRAARVTKGLDVPPAVRKRVLAEEGRTCRYCGGEADNPHIDHIMPWLGSERRNLTVACPSCNNDKKDLDLLSWARTQGSEFAARAQNLIFERELGSPRCHRCETEMGYGAGDVICDECYRELNAD